MNHQTIIEQLSNLAPKLKEASCPEDVLVKYATDRNLSAAQLERIGQVYNIAKTLNFMDKAANRGDSFRVLDTEDMLTKFTKFKPAQDDVKAADTSDWNSWFDYPSKAASADEGAVKSASIKEEDGQFTVYSEDGSKRLSKPGTKAQAEKRARQLEYFQAHKKSASVPNLLEIARDSSYSYYGEWTVEDLPPASQREVLKDDMRKESAVKAEVAALDQIMDDSIDTVTKVAQELLELHRISPIPFSVMERDAFYCSDNSDSIKVASDKIAGYFKQKGWELNRHDFSSKPPALAIDRHNVLPLFKSAAESIELYAGAAKYKEHYVKEALGATAPPPKQTAGQSQGQQVSFPAPRQPGNAGGGISQDDINNILLNKLYPKEEAPKEKDIDESKIKNVAKGITETFSPSTYLSPQQKSMVDNLMKPVERSKVNKKQMGVDTAVRDVGRVSTLQRLMLSDPIIGEAEPETIVNLYNTLAKANPEIVEDPNLLRFALREAVQYDAVPLHTYKDLISMGKDKVKSELDQHELTNRRYSI
jgi:hypothetical protein